VPARRDRSCEGLPTGASFDAIYRKLGAAADRDAPLFPAPALEDLKVQRRCQVYVGPCAGGDRYRILLLRLACAMKQNKREHNRSDSRQFATNSVARQETILCGYFLISQDVFGNAGPATAMSA
jgi:hypothetical protein